VASALPGATKRITEPAVTDLGVLPTVLNVNEPSGAIVIVPIGCRRPPRR
jgi:hypothetical protein